MGTINEISDPTIVIGALTDAGRSGKNNEDNFVVFESQVGGKEGATGWATVPVLMVADGIGGNVAGETASQMAVDTFREAFLHAQSPSLSQRLVEALESANSAIYQKTLEQPNLQGMGTTVVAAALLRERLYVAHAGDSRAYLIRKGKAYQLTLDHTWAQEAIEAGRLTPAQAREHPNRHVIKRYVGIAPTVEVDPLLVDINRGPLDPDQIQSWPKSDHLDLQADDTLLLCSDGLTDVVSDKEIEQTVTRNQPQEAARKLIELANKAGGPDNITVLILQRRQPGAPVAKPGGRSPVMAAILGAALIMMTVGAWLFLQNQVDNSANGITATATLTATVVEAVAAAPTTLEATATLAPTATPVPTVATATATATSTNTPALLNSQTANTPTATVGISNTTVTLDANQVASAAAATMAGSAADVITTIDSETTPTMTPTRRKTTQREPTSTAIPEMSKTPTATPTLTPVATATRATSLTTVVPTKTVSVSANNPPIDLTNAGVSLLSPTNDSTLDSKQTFSWAANFNLPADYEYEIVFWQAGQDAFKEGLGFSGTTTSTNLSVNVDVFRERGQAQGEYYWGIMLVKKTPLYDRVKYLGGQNLIHIKYPEQSSGNGSGGRETNDDN